uniref:Uncharacterized protein n=1 Tax=Oryza sativa subsp. japonica TaxID=39947 RepID=Q8LH05_ORYSJ|nr:hypothetical protein [Oryza sativa Japonica Group]
MKMDPVYLAVFYFPSLIPLSPRISLSRFPLFFSSLLVFSARRERDLVGVSACWRGLSRRCKCSPERTVLSVCVLTGEMPRVQTSRLGKNPIEVDSDGGEDFHVDYEVGNDVDEGPEHGEIDGVLSVVLRKMDKKSKVHSKTEPSYSRFSTKYFSTVLSSLSPDQKRIIGDYGFNSLLMFDNAYVPNKFSSWIANHVDVKSSQIVLKDKVIAINKECVHHILGLPIGGMEFPTDCDAGKSFILSKFGKSALPSVRFFGDKFIRKETLSDDEVITSFLIVAMACFLCPNSSLVLSTKYLTVFEND